MRCVRRAKVAAQSGHLTADRVEVTRGCVVEGQRASEGTRNDENQVDGSDPFTAEVRNREIGEHGDGVRVRLRDRLVGTVTGDNHP